MVSLNDRLCSGKKTCGLTSRVIHPGQVGLQMFWLSHPHDLTFPPMFNLIPTTNWHLFINLTPEFVSRVRNILHIKFHYIFFSLFSNIQENLLESVLIPTNPFCENLEDQLIFTLHSCLKKVYYKGIKTKTNQMHHSQLITKLSEYIEV